MLETLFQVAGQVDFWSLVNLPMFQIFVCYLYTLCKFMYVCAYGD